MVLQILVNLIFAAGFIVVWIRLNKPAKDDPRLSRGLQLLQSKIAILEDLSDQVERQVQQVVQLMEIKAKDLQSQVSQAEDQMRHIEAATSKSLEVAKIFQDRIPHEEFVDRKSTLKYIKAARLAHGGMAIDDIAEQVDLSRGEIEFIAKVNRDQLQFSDTDLPDWARSTEVSPTETLVESQPLMRFTDHATEGTGHAHALNALGSRFREAFEAGPNPELVVPTPPAPSVAASSKNQVKKVIFPRIDKPLF